MTQDPNAAADLRVFTVRVARALAIVPIVFGGAALLGWTTGIAQLTRVLASTPDMVPNTALATIALGVAVRLVASSSPSRFTRAGRTASAVIASGVFLLALAQLIEYALGTDLGTGGAFAWLVAAPAPSPEALRSSPQTVQSLLLAASGTLLLCMRGTAERTGAQAMGLGVAILAMVALVGYLLDVNRFYLADPSTGIGMSLPTAFSLLALGLAMLVARADDGLMKIVTQTTFGGALARQVMLAVVLLPIGLGLVGALFGNFTTFSPEVGVPLFVIANLIALTAVVWTSARSFDRLESARRHVDAALQRAATVDPLTGLPNRRRFLELLEEAFEEVRTDPSSRAVMLLFDLDRFKLINDSFGHVVGDELLVRTAKRIDGVLPEGATLARLSGDEFVVLLRRVRAAGTGERAAARVQDALRAPVWIDGRSIQIAASIGIVTSNARYRHALELLRDADIAMYEAKRNGEPWHAYTADLHAKVVASVELESELREALEHGEVHPYYQPIVRADTRELVGFEALVRWRHPKRGALAAEAFVPLAEEAGLIVEIDRSVLRRAGAQLDSWRAAHPELKLNLNLSPRHFLNADVGRQTLEALERSGTALDHLHIELTESGFMESLDTARTLLERLRRSGARLHLDDFGTGYSSLSYLQRLPVDALKLDRSFVRELAEDPGDTAFLEAIVRLSKSLGLVVVAEGVESEAQANLLDRIGCDLLQGFLFAPALDADAAEAWMRGAAA